MLLRQVVIGYDLGRSGAWSFFAEGTATAIVTAHSFSGALATLLGVAWN